MHVRFSDVDVYGHVNNVKYFEYFMEARILMTARLWKGVPEGTPEPSMVVAQTDVDYKVPILFRPEPYDAWSWISRVGERSMTIESEICDGDTVLSRARVAMVFFDPTTARPTPPPGGLPGAAARGRHRLTGCVAGCRPVRRRARRPRWRWCSMRVALARRTRSARWRYCFRLWRNWACGPVC